MDDLISGFLARTHFSLINAHQASHPAFPYPIEFSCLYRFCLGFYTTSHTILNRMGAHLLSGISMACPSFNGELKKTAPSPPPKKSQFFHWIDLWILCILLLMSNTDVFLSHTHKMNVLYIMYCNTCIVCQDYNTILP